jgi:hypothetical protein
MQKNILMKYLLKISLEHTKTYATKNAGRERSVRSLAKFSSIKPILQKQ